MCDGRTSKSNGRSEESNLIQYDKKMKTKIELHIYSDSTTEVISESESMLFNNPLNFNLNKNQIVLLFHLLLKKEIIENGSNELFRFIERNFWYWNEEEKKHKPITGARTLISQFTNGDRKIKHVMNDNINVLRNVKDEIETLICLIENTVVEKTNK
jgi:hypothetical protein